jgi:hypothetical protein
MSSLLRLEILPDCSDARSAQQSAREGIVRLTLRAAQCRDAPSTIALPTEVCSSSDAARAFVQRVGRGDRGLIIGELASSWPGRVNLTVPGSADAARRAAQLLPSRGRVSVRRIHGTLRGRCLSRHPSCTSVSPAGVAAPAEQLDLGTFLGSFVARALQPDK